MMSREDVLNWAARSRVAWFSGKDSLIPDAIADEGWLLVLFKGEVRLKKTGVEVITEFDWRQRRTEMGLDKIEPVSRPDGPTASEAVIDQPKPSGTGTPVVAMVMHDMIERMEKGIETYGQALRADNGRCPLIDAYQEALDLAIYLKQAIIENNGKES